MDKVTKILNDQYFHSIDWIGSLEDGKLNPDEFTTCNGLDEHYMMGIYCLLHKNLIGDSVQHLEKSTSHNALYILGRLYFLNTHGLKYDVIKGMECLNKAYVEGNLDAGLSIARIFYFGIPNEIAQTLHAAEYICDDLLSKSYNQKCTTKRIGFYPVCISIAYTLGKYDKIIELTKLAKETGCTCYNNELGAMYSLGYHFQQNEKKALEMYQKVDLTKCTSINLYWNMSRSYHLLDDYKTSIIYLMKTVEYRKHDPVTSKPCYDQIRNLIASRPDAIIDLIKDGTFTFEALK